MGLEWDYTLDMMKRARFHLVPTTCRRCGKAIYTGSKALVGTPEMKARYERLCESCFTPDEREAMDSEYRHLAAVRVR